jgi:WD40 repeat protein
VNGSKLYAGGIFTAIGGQSRTSLAELDVSTGLATSWNPGASSTVNALAVDGTTLYVGGSFTSIGGQPRNRIAAFDMGTGLLTTWDPNATGSVTAFAVDGPTIYVGGLFTGIGGQTRSRVAALEKATGLATTWSVNPNSMVTSIAPTSGTIYITGAFSNIGTTSITGLAGLDATSGAITWKPGLNAQASMATISDGKLFVGGGFSLVNNESFYGFAVFPVGSPLPVQLISFTANPTQGMNPAVICKWQTASEQQSSHFVVERSPDGRNFASIGRVAAAGNSAAVLSYTFTDALPLLRTAYYRLKQVDADGRSSYSRVVVVVRAAGSNTFVTYPNPVSEVITLSLIAGRQLTTTLNVFELSGRKLFSRTVQLQKGANTVSLPVGHLPTGTYFVQRTDEEGRQQGQFIKR